MRRALAVLHRTEQTQQITVVIPWDPNRASGEGLRLDDLIVPTGDPNAVRIQHAPAAS
jgi:hypothetical protein